MLQAEVGDRGHSNTLSEKTKKENKDIGHTQCLMKRLSEVALLASSLRPLCVHAELSKAEGEGQTATGGRTQTTACAE